MLDWAGSATRLGIAGIGLMCVVAAVILLASGGSAKGPISATIMCELDPALVSDEITVFLDGRSVGIIRVDEHSPRAKLRVTVSKAGRHDYRLRSTRRVKGGELRRVTHTSDVVIDGKHPLLIYYGMSTLTPRLSQPL
jgi:hypothetical protein